MFVSVASDLPSLTRFSQYKDAQSSVLLDDLGHPIGVLSQQNRVIVTPAQIPPIVKEAVVSIEDKRFYTNSGVDLRGIARALRPRHPHKGGVQGASTIEQQFIKNALQAQSHRTIFEKLREAALAYQLSHKWSKEKILTAYLNTIYFGNGAYGIEAAAQTYFGHDANHLGCGMPGHELCVAAAAAVGGRAAGRRDPVADRIRPGATKPAAARDRRDMVLRQMLEQGYLTRPIYEESIAQPLPAATRSRRREEQTVEGVDAGYFTSWVQQQVIERYGAQRAFDGGPEDQDHARPRTPARRRTGRQRLPRRPRRPHRVAGGDRKLHRRGARDGRAGATTTKAPSTSPPRASASRARSFKAFDLAAALEARHLARLGVDLQAEGVHRPHTTARNGSSSTTTKAPTRARTR